MLTFFQNAVLEWTSGLIIINSVAQKTVEKYPENYEKIPENCEKIPRKL